MAGGNLRRKHKPPGMVLAREPSGAVAVDGPCSLPIWRPSLLQAYELPECLPADPYGTADADGPQLAQLDKPVHGWAADAQLGRDLRDRQEGGRPVNSGEGTEPQAVGKGFPHRDGLAPQSTVHHGQSTRRAARPPPRGNCGQAASLPLAREANRHHAREGPWPPRWRVQG
jgi:hypothetical protein